MSLFECIPLLASVFTVEAYPPALTSMLETHFEHYVQIPFSLIPIPTHGATRTYYYVLTVSDQRFFVKYGEKVDLEIANQMRLPLSLPIPPSAPGTSLDQKILVRPFLTDPNFGFDLVEALYTSCISGQQFLDAQESVFERAFSLYGKPSFPSGPSKFFVSRVDARLKAILDDPNVDAFLKSSDLPEELTDRSLFTRPILYQSQVQVPIILPSIYQMVEQFIKQFPTVPELHAAYRIHGDMHPPNVAWHRPIGIVFIDLSDICEGEDPCWDLGKWMNHVKRLHPVVQRRDYNQTDPEVTIQFRNDRVELCDSTYYPPDRGWIGNKGVAQFARFLREPVPLVELRSRGAEFVANINTLKRHLELFPMMTKRLLCLIAESYLEWTHAFDHYDSKDSA